MLEAAALGRAVNHELYASRGEGSAALGGKQVIAIEDEKSRAR
jgi:hypothetical protein